MELPEWTDIVKTARFKELAPYDPDWYYVRAGEFLVFDFVHFLVTCLIDNKNFCGTFSINFFVYNCNVFFCAAASIARKIYLRGGLGVGAFQRIYGGSQRNGSRPPHFCKSSGSIARHILQQLQNMNLIEMDTKG